MKRYLVFTTFDYSADGGLKNLHSEANTLDEAVRGFYEEDSDSIAYKTPTDNEWGVAHREVDEVHILDTQTGQKYFARGYKELKQLTAN